MRDPSGWRPLLEAKFLFVMISGIFSVFYSRNIRLKISTNAYAVTEDIADRLARLKHVGNVAISIDGPELIHNAIRGRKDAFQRTTAAISLFKKRGLAVSITSVLQPDNVDVMEEILRTCQALRVDRVSIIPFTYKKRSEERASAEDVSRLRSAFAGKG